MSIDSKCKHILDYDYLFLIYNSKHIHKLYDKLDLPLLHTFLERTLIKSFRSKLQRKQ